VRYTALSGLLRRIHFMKILAVLLFVIMAGIKAFPCWCNLPDAKTMREVAQSYVNQSDVNLIFEGKVVKQELHNGALGEPANALSMTGTGRFRVVDFAVMRTFRGDHQDRISISTGLGGGDCGYDFQPNYTYLVYAGKGPDGLWFASICSGTNAIEDAGTALRLLAGEKPVAEDLLSPEDYWKLYFKEVVPKRTGSICGVVLRPDGKPLRGAQVDLWELRTDDLPPRTASDPNTSTRTGHFCIQDAQPGRYFLTAESVDFEHDARDMAFYPGVDSRRKAAELTIEPGVRLPDIKLTTFRERLYTIHIRVVSSNGTRFSYKNGCAVSVDSIYGDPLSYHIRHTLEEDGSYTFGYIPAGKYVITTYFQFAFNDGEMEISPEASRWKPARQEVVVRGDTEVIVPMELAKPD